MGARVKVDTNEQEHLLREQEESTDWSVSSSSSSSSPVSKAESRLRYTAVPGQSNPPSASSPPAPTCSSTSPEARR